MPSVLWLLVQSNEESDMFPNFEVLGVKPKSHDKLKLRAGKYIMLRPEHSTSKQRYLILRISGKKHILQEDQRALIDQNNRFKDRFSNLMRKVIDNEDIEICSQCHDDSSSSCSSSSTHDSLTASEQSSDSEVEMCSAERNHHDHHSRHLDKPTRKYKRQGSASRLHPNLTNDQQKQRPSMDRSSPLPNDFQEEVIITADQGTQTDGLNFRGQEVMDIVKHKLTELRLSAADVFSKGKTVYVSVDESDAKDTLDTGDDCNYEGEDRNNRDRENRDEVSGTEQNNTVNVHPGTSNPENLRTSKVSEHTTSNIKEDNSEEDTVPIGNGNARIPKKLLSEIDWSLYTTATRHLMRAIFSRNTLATHSPTDESHDRRQEKRLDPKLVKDIVITVSQRCGVPMCLVRNIIQYDLRPSN